MYDHFNVKGKSFPYIPPQAFLYQPTSKNPDVQNQSTESLQTDDFLIKTKDNEIKRLIFEGGAKFTKFQNSKIEEFEDYLRRKKISIDPRWNRSWKLRWLQSTNYDNKKTVQDMLKYIEYLDKNKEIHLTPNVQKCLKSGIYYIAGRDSKYRPLIILDVKKMIKMNLNEEEIYQCQVYFFQFILRNLLIPGRVEMWNTIIDVGYQGVMSMMGPMKSSISFLQSTFRSRMYVAYIIRPSGTCSFLWSIAQKFLQQDTKRKVVFVDGQIMSALLQYCNPTQLEKKFGGSLQIEPNTYWPPKIYSQFFESKIERRILTENQYNKKYEQKQLQNTKIYEPFLHHSDPLINHQADLKVQSKIKSEPQAETHQKLTKVETLSQTNDPKINLIEADKRIKYCLQKLKQQNITFLQSLNMQTKQLAPPSGFEWLSSSISNGSSDTISFST